MSELNRYAGVQIKKRRKRRGLTLKNVAQQLGSTAQTIQRLEAGKMTVSLEWLEKLAGVLKCTPQELLTPYFDGGQFECNCAEWPEMPPRRAGLLKKNLETLIEAASNVGELLAEHGDFTNEFYPDTIGQCSSLIKRAKTLRNLEGEGRNG